MSLHRPCKDDKVVQVHKQKLPFDSHQYNFHFWNFLGLSFSPNGIWRNLYKPWWGLKVILFLVPSSIWFANIQTAFYVRNIYK